ncbi:hypothetical protein MAF45_04675 [Mesosutterella sp. OilRF-GAM-744-9]|uniref:Uncharacterized protein n=1 Tax=Mesosutterella porci TaxID=2915351 RepID=A0ABS9MQZ5_9BURK|nr:hypothetical protein [Mesosutterella sp. oilRF-744-WT-GAM-9]MCG5030739.1 hypothetical protein [Mesosutterella sp. oilRF-744-WT-GAM-9]
MKKILAVAAVLGVFLSATAFADYTIPTEWVDMEGIKHQELIYVQNPPSKEVKHIVINSKSLEKIKADEAARKAKDEQDRLARENHFHDNGWSGRYKEYVNPVTKQRILVDPKTRNIKLPE